MLLTLFYIYAQTCTHLYSLTQDRYYWLRILQEQSLSLPLPTHIKHPSSWLHLTARDIEAVVRQLHIASRTWLLPRSQFFTASHSATCVLDSALDNDDGARTIYSLDMYLARWLVCIYHEKTVEIWDLDSTVRPPHQPVLCTSHHIGGTGSFDSAITHLDEHDNTLTVVVSW